MPFEVFAACRFCFLHNTGKTRGTTHLLLQLRILLLRVDEVEDDVERAREDEREEEAEAGEVRVALRASTERYVGARREREGGRETR